MPDSLHPWAAAYMNRLQSGVQTKPMQTPQRQAAPLFTQDDYEREQQCIAKALGGSIDQSFYLHSVDVMKTLFETCDVNQTTERAAHLLPLSEGDNVGKESSKGYGAPVIGIKREPSVSEVSDAITRHLFHRNRKFQQLLQQKTMARSTDSDPYVHVLSTFDGVLSSIVRFSVDYATFTDTLSDLKLKNSRQPTPTVYTFRGEREDDDFPQPPAAGSWDEIAASQQMLEILSSASMRSRLQRAAWPAVSALHQAILKRVDDVFYKDGHAAQELTVSGKTFLTQAGLGEDLTALKEELFSFPGNMFAVLRPQDRGKGVRLTSPDNQRLRDSTSAYDVVVPLANLSSHYRFFVQGKKLIKVMGSPSTNLFVARAPPPSETIVVLKDIQSKQRGENLSERDRLWLLLEEMTKLRILATHLLSIEMMLNNVKHAHQQRLGGKDASDDEETLLSAAREVVHVARRPIFAVMRAALAGFRSHAALHSLSEMRAGNGQSSAPTLPSITVPDRFTSAAQLYNTFARLLRVRGGEPMQLSTRNSEKAEFSFTRAAGGGCGSSPSADVGTGCIRATAIRRSDEVEWPFQVLSRPTNAGDAVTYVLPYAANQTPLSPPAAASVKALFHLLGTHPVLAALNGHPLPSLHTAEKLLHRSLKLQFLLRRR